MLRVSISKSRNSAFQPKTFSTGGSMQLSRFHLGIKNLDFSTEFQGWDGVWNGEFPSRNRESALFNNSQHLEIKKYVIEFPSRNRESLLFNAVKMGIINCDQALFPSRNRESLLFNAGTVPLRGDPGSLFPSRNRESLLFNNPLPEVLPHLPSSASIPRATIFHKHGDHRKT